MTPLQRNFLSRWLLGPLTNRFDVDFSFLHPGLPGMLRNAQTCLDLGRRCDVMEAQIEPLAIYPRASIMILYPFSTWLEKQKKYRQLSLLLKLKFS